MQPSELRDQYDTIMNKFRCILILSSPLSIWSHLGRVHRDDKRFLASPSVAPTNDVPHSGRRLVGARTSHTPSLAPTMQVTPEPATEGRGTPKSNNTAATGAVVPDRASQPENPVALAIFTEMFVKFALVLLVLLGPVLICGVGLTLPLFWLCHKCSAKDTTALDDSTHLEKAPHEGSLGDTNFEWEESVDSNFDWEVSVDSNVDWEDQSMSPSF